MGEVQLAIAVVGVLVLVPAGIAWLGLRARRRGIGGSVLQPFEEIWDPVAHHTQIEVQVQAERTDPAPAPGDPPGPAARRGPPPADAMMGQPGDDLRRRSMLRAPRWNS